MIGRPKKYDRKTVLDAAMNAFWDRGYEGTSIADLVTATGLHKGSLYQAFGDKHTLFCACLEHYFDTVYQFKRELLESAATPAAGIREGWIEMLFSTDQSESEASRGCLAINTLVELAPHDSQVEQILTSHFQRTLALMTKTIETAAEAGEIDLRYPPEQSAAILMAFIAGLATSTKGLVSKEQGKILLEQQLALIGFKWTAN